MENGPKQPSVGGDSALVVRFIVPLHRQLEEGCLGDDVEEYHGNM